MVWLRQHGWTPGDRIGLGLSNQPDGAALLQATLLAGLTAVLFHRQLHPEVLRQQAAAMALTAVVVAEGHPLAQIGCPVTLPLPTLNNLSAPLLLSPIVLNYSAPALILFTSGTSGESKAVQLSHRAVAAAAQAAVTRLGLNPADTWLACLPMDHIGGASIVLRAALCGYRLVFTERFSTDVVTNLIDHAGITGLSVVPTMLHRLIEQRGTRPWPATLRCLLTGGGPLSRELIARSTALGLAPCETYGLSEACSQVCTLAPAEAAAHPGSAGRPVDGMAVTIRSPDGDTLSAGISGQICIRGASLFDGYVLPAPKGHAAHCAIRENAAFDAMESHPAIWHPTGDLGWMDADGFLHILGRLDDMIISGGENIAPAEIEAALERHPGIAAAGVYGLPDAEWGHIVAAALVARDQPVSADEIQAFLRTQLSRFQRPRHLAWVPSLPTTATGKIQRSRLREWVSRPKGPLSEI